MYELSLKIQKPFLMVHIFVIISFEFVSMVRIILQEHSILVLLGFKYIIWKLSSYSSVEISSDAIHAYDNWIHMGGASLQLPPSVSQKESQRVSKSPNLVTTSPPKWLGGISWNFQKIFWRSLVVHLTKYFNLQGQYTALRSPLLLHTTFSLVNC